MSYLSYLCTQPEVADFLGHYKPADWSQVVLVTLLYGIQTLKAIHPRPPPLEILTYKSCRASALVQADNLLPHISQQVKTLCHQLQRFEATLKDDSKKKPQSSRTPSNRKKMKKQPTRLSQKKTNQRPWVADLTHLVKPQAVPQSPRVAYEPPDYPIYEPRLRSAALGQDSTSERSSRYLRRYAEESLLSESSETSF